MRFRARITGGGSAEISAYGVPDAEHALEKELVRTLPGARLRIREIHRTDASARIVEGFRLLYTMTAEVEVEAPDEEKARSAAFAEARRALENTRFARVQWDPKVVFQATLPDDGKTAHSGPGGE